MPQDSELPSALWPPSHRTAGAAPGDFKVGWAAAPVPHYEWAPLRAAPTSRLHYLQEVLGAATANQPNGLFRPPAPSDAKEAKIEAAVSSTAAKEAAVKAETDKPGQGDQVMREAKAENEANDTASVVKMEE